MEVPSDLDTAGRELWLRIDAWRTEQTVTFEPWELALVVEVCRTVDRCAQLRARSATAADEDSWIRLVREERLQRMALGRVIAASGLPTGLVQPDAAAGGDGAPVGLSPKSRRGQKAARARWSGGADAA